MIDVIIPTGTIIGDKTLRPMVSHINKKTEPTNAEPTIRNSSLLPIHRLTICGTTNPIKAITPKKETTIDVHIVANIKPEIRILSGLTPMLRAYSSPALTAL